MARAKQESSAAHLGSDAAGTVAHSRMNNVLRFCN